MALTQLVNVPQTNDPFNFQSYADNLLAVQLPRLINEINALPLGGGTGGTVGTTTGTGNTVLSSSPTLTDVPIAPTALNGTNTNQIATTAFVINNTAMASGGFISGTRMSFNQPSAPIGWVKDTSPALDDAIMRVVTGNGGGTGGILGFSSFNSQTMVGNTTLSTAQIPSHVHQFSSNAGSGSAFGYGLSAGASAGINTSATGGGGSHNHTLITNIKYYDCIIAVKS